VKPEAIEYGDRRVYSVGAFNRGVASWLGRLPTVWVEELLLHVGDPVKPGQPIARITTEQG